VEPCVGGGKLGCLALRNIARYAPVVEMGMVLLFLGDDELGWRFTVRKCKGKEVSCAGRPVDT
jgi:hypothetical protein